MNNINRPHPMRRSIAKIRRHGTPIMLMLINFSNFFLPYGYSSLGIENNAIALKANDTLKTCQNPKLNVQA